MFRQGLNTTANNRTYSGTETGSQFKRELLISERPSNVQLLGDAVTDWLWT